MVVRAMDNVRFSREQDEYSLILDQHWRAEFENIAIARNSLRPFFSDPEYSTVELYVAGKGNGPNPACLETASQALNDLESTLDELKTNLQPRNPDWHFSSITVPYQFVRIYYLTYWSEYGVDIEYGIKMEDCPYGHRGIYAETDVVTVASIPGDISCIIRDLTSANVDEDELRDVRQEIEKRELFGHELVPQLKVLLQRHGQQWHNGTAQLQALSEIERLVNETR